VKVGLIAALALGSVLLSAAPAAADPDCEDFGGRVSTVYSDPYDLDRDADGIGCEIYDPVTETYRTLYIPVEPSLLERIKDWASREWGEADTKTRIYTVLTMMSIIYGIGWVIQQVVLLWTSKNSKSPASAP
jgi:hypothetical protein